MTKHNNKMLIGLVFFSMIVLGTLESIRGALIPSIQGFYSIDYGQVGSFLLISSLGYIAANFIGGNIVDRLGHKKIFFLGILLITIGIVGMAIASNYILFLIATAIVNYGFGSVRIGSDTIAPVIFKKNQGIMLNLLHFFYGVGTIIGPGYVGIALNKNLTWQETYKYSLVLLGIFTVYLIISKFPKTHQASVDKKLPLKEILTNKKVILFACILGFYVAAEIGVANWLTTYLQSSHNMNISKATVYLSLFFTVFTFGRLIGGFIVEKLGYLNSIIGFLIIGLVLFILGTNGSSQLIILISISGFFFSIIYPTTFALVIKEFDKSASNVIGVIITISSGINMIGNKIIGQVSDNFGVLAGFRLIGLFLFLTILLILVLKKHIISQ